MVHVPSVDPQVLLTRFIINLRAKVLYVKHFI